MNWRTRLEALPCKLGTGASLAEVEAAEAALAITFPASYREFLQHVGWANVEDMLVLYGLGADCPPEYQLVELAAQAREQGLPSDFLAIADDTVMGLMFLKVLEQPARIIAFDEEANEEELSDDFEDWLDGELCDFEDEELDNED